VIGGFYIGEYYCILHALGNKKENLVVFNLADFCNSPNHQNKFHAKFSSYTVFINYSSINRITGTSWVSVDPHHDSFLI